MLCDLLAMIFTHVTKHHREFFSLPSEPTLRPLLSQIVPTLRWIQNNSASKWEAESNESTAHSFLHESYKDVWQFIPKSLFVCLHLINVHMQYCNRSVVWAITLNISTAARCIRNPQNHHAGAMFLGTRQQSMHVWVEYLQHHLPPVYTRDNMDS